MLSRLTFSRWVLLALLPFPANAQLPAPAAQNAEAPGVQGPAPIGELFASEPGAAAAALPAGSGMAGPERGPRADLVAKRVHGQRARGLSRAARSEIRQRGASKWGF